jgi:hypothetical protein
MGIRTQSLRAATTRALGAPMRRSPNGVRLRDRFELLVPLGSGGFGTVWEGFDMLLERPVAIKEIIFDEELSDIGDALREARATARLNHPGIVSLYEIVNESDRIYMISELVNGCTLGEMIDEGMMSDHDVGRIGYGLCEALAHAHSQGVIHRDVKPANVMVTTAWLEGSGGWRSQPAKLMDFGIASIVDSGERGVGPHAGSRGYVAPEQQSGDPATPATDVYSLALVLFECFTGAAPGRGRTARLARVRRDLPIELTECLDDCLEPDPMMRPEVEELGARISAVLPYLSDDLPAPGLGGRLRRLFTREHAVAPAPAPRRAQVVEPEPGSGRFWRFGLAGLAAGICAVTMLAASLPLSFVQPLIAALLVFLLPRAGWAVAATAGAVALAVDGQVGSAMFMVLPAVVAAFAAMVPLPRVFDGALAGAGAFAWVVAMQAMSGTSLALSLPQDFGDPAEVRQFADVALDGMMQLAQPAYTASLGLWALTGAAAILFVDRRVGLIAWSGLAALAFAAQVMIGQTFEQPVPTLTLVAVPLAVISTLLAAAAVRRIGRVFVLPDAPEMRPAGPHNHARV